MNSRYMKLGNPQLDAGRRGACWRHARQTRLNAKHTWLVQLRDPGHHAQPACSCIDIDINTLTSIDTSFRGSLLRTDHCIDINMYTH